MVSEINGSGGFGGQMSNQALNETMKQKLQSQGIPEDVISQGREEIKAWVMENKENKQNSSSESLFNITA